MKKEIEEEVLSPKYNRKYANKRKFLLKDKKSLYKKTQDKSILDGDVFYGKQLQKTNFDGMDGSAYYGKTFIGVPLSKKFATDHNDFQLEAMHKLSRHRKFCEKEQIDDFYESDYETA